MTKHSDDPELGIFVDDTLWQEICAEAGFRCRQCGDPPLVEDAPLFLDEKLCGSCAAAVRRWQDD